MNQTIAPAAALMTLFTILLIVFAIALLPLIFYCLTIQKAMNRCSPENRAMAPGMVWLLLVPLVNIIWHFFVVMNVAKSMAAEYQKRGLAVEPNPGQNIGLVMCIAACCGFVPIVNLLAAPTAFVCWIIYWVKVAGLSTRLA